MSVLKSAIDRSQGHMCGCPLIVLGTCTSIYLYRPLSGPPGGQQKMPSANSLLRHYGNFKLKGLKTKKSIRCLILLFFFPRAGEEGSTQKMESLYQMKMAFLWSEWVVEMEETLFNYILLKALTKSQQCKGSFTRLHPQMKNYRHPETNGF